MFVTTGNAAQLSECFSILSEENPVRPLLAAMVEFFDSVNLCSLSGIDKTLSDLKRLIDETLSSSAGGMDMFLFRQIIPVIRQKFFGDTDSPDYCRIILWCLDNHLIQQAITLYVEKMPKYLFDKGILSATDKLKKATSEKHNKPEQINLEKEIFFSNLMSCDGLSTAEKKEQELIDELKTALSDRDYRTQKQQVITAKRHISCFYHYSKNFDNCGKAVESIIAERNSDFGLMAIARALSDKKCAYDDSKVYISFQNNEPVLRAVLSLPPAKPNSPEKTLEIKMNTIENALKLALPEGLSVSISRSALQRIMLDYLYARQIRNRINHALDSETSTQKLDALFKKHGIDSSFGMKAIISQLRGSVEFVMSL